jgi:hypothetical protein
VLLANSTIFADWVLSPDDAVALFDEPTVLRTRVMLTPSFAGTGGAAGTVLVTAGIIVANNLLSIPDPMVEAWKDWIWHSAWYMTASPAENGPNTAAITQQDQWDDVKTKRRIEAGQGLMFVIRCSAPDVSVGSAAAANAFVRMLVGH